jgi:L,D-transpeptidase ErfK/SrfK
MPLITLIFIMPFIAMGQMYQISPNSDIIGEIYHLEVNTNISLERLAKREKVGYHELLIANPHIGRIAERGDTVIIPAMYILPPEPFRSGIVINTAEPRLYYFTSDGEFVFTTPIAVGRAGWRTPLFSGTIIHKKNRPTWTPPESIRAHHYKTHNEHLPSIIPPGPDNPLGNYAIYTSKARILIHGTNNENSIGKYSSSGCIRLYNEDIQTLFRIINIHDPVSIIHIPVKIGYHQGNRYIETHREVFSESYDNVFNIHHESFDLDSNGIPVIR